ncbi:MAG: hypothetical protein M0P20_10325 [Methanocorpusculum sp.]|nr:hypothetical protein [Methanocorpusculum sp.]
MPLAGEATLADGRVATGCGGSDSCLADIVILRKEAGEASGAADLARNGDDAESSPWKNHRPPPLARPLRLPFTTFFFDEK